MGLDGDPIEPGLEPIAKRADAVIEIIVIEIIEDALASFSDIRPGKQWST